MDLSRFVLSVLDVFYWRISAISLAKSGAEPKSQEQIVALSMMDKMAWSILFISLTGNVRLCYAGERNKETSFIILLAFLVAHCFCAKQEAIWK